MAQIYYYDPQSGGINMQSPQSESTPRRQTLINCVPCLFFRNCLFRALSDQLFGHPEKHKQLRKEVVTYMRNHKEDFEPFHSDENVPFDHHLDLLERDGTYAGNDGLVAFARANNITIAIHQLNEPLWQIHGSTNGDVLEPEICFIEALAIIKKEAFLIDLN